MKLLGPDRRAWIALLMFLCLIYLPFAGNYGMWDPWETHYSEVARQMRMRNDYVSLWWPGSPQDRNEFWSKPVLTFWLMAMGMTVARLEPGLPMSDPHFHDYDGEMATGWTAEWAVRIPFILCSILCVWAVWELTRRLGSRRAGFWAGVVLATCSQYAFITRQAMTDMAFVAPMTVALCCVALGLLLPKEEVEDALPRRERGRFSWPDARLFDVVMGVAFLTIVPQLLLMSVQVTMAFTVGRKAIRVAGIVPMLPYWGAFALWAWYAAKATCRRQLYMHMAFLMCGIATLAKGPAGVAMPVIVVLLYLALSGQWRSLLPQPADPASGKWADRVGGPGGFLVRFVVRHPLEVGMGVLVFIAVTFPWYHAMLIRHGMGFWNEFIGDNYVHRAAGRHGDRGTFEYYLLQIGLGTFPWSGVIPAAVLMSLGKLRGTDARTRLRGFALVWFLVMFAVVTLVNTKFHHYILPALPALAVLAGLWLDDLTSHPRVQDGIALLLVGLPVLGLSGRDYALFAPRLQWLFDYDYVNAPNGGRAWPPGEAYKYGTRIAAFLAVALLCSLVLGLVTIARAGQARIEAGEADTSTSPSTTILAVLGVLALGTFVGAQVWQPAFGDGLPHVLDNGWILPAAAGVLFLIIAVSADLGDAARRGATLALLFVGGIGVVWSAWILDRHLTDISPHWSQKHVMAAYYRLRRSPEEPLIAWQMYWRGETFYTKNAIYDHRIDQKDKTVFLGDHNAEKMQSYFKTHGNRRVFFIVERSRFESLRALLPEAAKATLKAVDESNNKVYLAQADLPVGEPDAPTPPTGGGTPTAAAPGAPAAPAPGAPAAAPGAPAAPAPGAPAAAPGAPAAPALIAPGAARLARPIVTQ